MKKRLYVSGIDNPFLSITYSSDTKDMEVINSIDFDIPESSGHVRIYPGQKMKVLKELSRMPKPMF